MGHSTKLYTGRLHPEVQRLTFLFTIFDVRMYPIRMHAIDKYYPFHKLSLRLLYIHRLSNMNKSLNQEVSCLFHSRAMHLLALLDPFTDLNNRFPYSFIHL